MQVKQQKGWRMSCDVGKATEWLENELQPFRHFTYVTTNSPTLPLLHLRHSSLQLFFRISYVTGSSLASPDEPPMHYRFLSRIVPYRIHYYSLRLQPESDLFGVNFFLIFRHKISEFRINCFKFTQYFAKISRLLFIIIIRESFVTNASK